MIYNYKVVCVIPARGGSKGLPRKNIKPFNGKPLIAYSILRAKESKYIDRVVVSTEDMEIAHISKSYGAEVPFMRPDYLASDHAATIDVLIHAIDWMEMEEKLKYHILVLLHVTAPLRNVADIDNSIEMLIESKADNVFSVTECHGNPYFNMIEVNRNGTIKLVKKGNYNSRQLAPTVYDMNASVYVWWVDIIKKKKKLITRKTRFYFMPKERSVDIDDDMDFRIAEFLQNNNNEGRSNDTKGI
jgi:CMP-N,N'-diacetyllegionaminic acid synthase